jgi:hypothetical protein
MRRAVSGPGRVPSMQARTRFPTHRAAIVAFAARHSDFRGMFRARMPRSGSTLQRDGTP